MTSHIKQKFGSHPLQVDDVFFDKANFANAMIEAAFSIEKAYDSVIGNYVELEREILSTSVSAAVCLFDSIDFFNIQSAINRRVVNLLTSIRLYMDMSPQLIGVFSEEGRSAVNVFKQKTSECYDSSFSYRFFEAFRNHVQHCGFAVHSCVVNHKFHESADSSQLVLFVQPVVYKEILAQDRKFKKSVLKEAPDEVVLTTLVREYIKKISLVQGVLRDIYNKKTIDARTVFQELVEFYGSKIDGPTNNLVICTNSTSIDGRKEVSLSLRTDDIRLRLKKRNAVVGAIDKLLITG